MPALPAPPTARRAAALVPVLVGITLVVAIISSLGAPLIPSVATSLDITLDSAQWSLTAALLAGAVSAPILGRLGDGPYRREAIAGSLLVVLAGSLVAGVAESLPVLVVGRTMQGVGLGLAPITMAAARDHLPPHRAPAVIGILSVSAAAGIGAGYPLSGLIAQGLGVHAAFLFGAVISALALGAALAVIPSSRESNRVPLDVRGAVVVAVGLVALLLAIGQGESWGWSSAVVVGLFALSVVVFALWVRMQLACAAPLVDLRQLRHRPVLVADFAAVLLGLALYMFLTLVTEFVQTPVAEGYGFGATTLVAGLCLVPFSIASLAASRTMGPLMRRLGARAVLVGGSLVISAAGVFFALVHGALWEAFVTMGVVGIGFGYTFAAIPGLITRAVPEEETGSAMGFYQVVRSIGFSVGSTLSASILAGHTAVGAALPSERGYVVALWVGAGGCALAAVASGVLSAGAMVGAPSAERVQRDRDDARLAGAGLPDAESDRPR
ncbi:MFS transporter [Baekduia soli]|uniref:MFS transporter n=1 Tax=Baekduia soli TaxID=496014 RepID=UPI001E4BE277|nr:MFS transporter [Baekduia soli]